MQASVATNCMAACCALVPPIQSMLHASHAHWTGMDYARLRQAKTKVVFNGGGGQTKCKLSYLNFRVRSVGEGAVSVFILWLHCYREHRACVVRTQSLVLES